MSLSFQSSAVLGCAWNEMVAILSSSLLFISEFASLINYSCSLHMIHTCFPGLSDNPSADDALAMENVAHFLHLTPYSGAFNINTGSLSVQFLYYNMIISQIMGYKHSTQKKPQVWIHCLYQGTAFIRFGAWYQISICF